jgi:hypothetical protein
MIQVALYQFKKQYSDGPLDIYKYSSVGVDLNTGERAETSTCTTIQKVVVLPVKAERAVVSSISKISADKAFVYGGTYDRTRRMFLIDMRDAPGLDLKKDDWLVLNGRRYDVATFDSFNFDSLWVVIGHEMVGDKPPNVIRVSITDALPLAGTGVTS